MPVKATSSDGGKKQLADVSLTVNLHCVSLVSLSCVLPYMAPLLLGPLVRTLAHGLLSKPMLCLPRLFSYCFLPEQ